MTSPFLDRPRFSVTENTLKAGVKALYASYPRAMPDHPTIPRRRRTIDAIPQPILARADGVIE